MATITEDYVSFETALLLKKKGFEQVGCEKQYNTLGDLCVGYCYGPVAPTLQMAMKWLREVHNIHVVPKFDFYAGYYTGRIYDGRRESAVEKEDYIAVVGNITYEQASEEAIKYTLENLIWVIMTYEEKKQVYIDKITNILSGKSLETLSRLYDIMTNLD